MADRTREVVWTAAALACLEEVLEYIAQDAPLTAGRVLEVFDANAASLADLAARGRVVPELREPTIREIFVYRYRLIYQLASTQVRILAVIPGEMDYRGWLKRQSEGT